MDDADGTFNTDTADILG